MGTVSIKDIYTVFHYIRRGTIHRSLIWLMIRTSSGSAGEIQEAWRDGIIKEIIASTSQFSEGPIFSYGELLPLKDPTVHPDHDSAAKMLIPMLSARLRQLPILFPKVNRRKNVSQETYRNFHVFRGEDIPPRNTVRTVDLERFYHETGVQVPGDPELRASWKYNDLKPRAYYCNGGTSYWSSRFLKFIAVEFMECFAPCARRNRMDPTGYLHPALHDDDSVLCWDYSSFTTNLSELKYFLSIVSSGLREEQTTVRILDSHFGVRDILVSDLLDEYNRDCNNYAEFSLHRILDRFSIDFAERSQQVNNGMLGVLGNIAFSTFLHAFIASEFVGPDNVVCVGDDAMAVTQHPRELRDHMQYLAPLHPSKFVLMGPIDEYSIQNGVFLKRQITRTSDEFFLDFLFNFPLIAYVIGKYDRNRTLFIDSDSDLLYAFSGQVSSLLWTMQAKSYVMDESEEMVLSNFLRLAYSKLQIPRHGLLPGSRFKDKIIRYAIPSIMFEEYNPGIVDWSEFLFEKHHGQYFLCTIEAEYGSLIQEAPYPSKRYYVAKSRGWTFLEDMGYVQMTRMTEYYRASTENLRKFRRMFNSFGQDMYEVEILREIPLMFHELVTEPYVADEFRVQQTSIV